MFIGFKRPVILNKYKATDNKVVESTYGNTKKHIITLLDSSYQGVKRLFILTYNNTASNNQVSVDSFKNIFYHEEKLKITKLM